MLLMQRNSFHPVIKVRAVQRSWTSRLTHSNAFSSRYQSPGGATFVQSYQQQPAQGFHPVIKVRAVQRLEV